MAPLPSGRWQLALSSQQTRRLFCCLDHYMMPPRCVARILITLLHFFLKEAFSLTTLRCRRVSLDIFAIPQLHRLVVLRSTESISALHSS